MKRTILSSIILTILILASPAITAHARDGSSETGRATGQTGTGHATVTSTYLYPGGMPVSTTLTDESGAQVRQVNTSYGSEGEVLGVSGNTAPVTYQYDNVYRRTAVIDPNGNTTHYSYTPAGYLDTITYPGGDKAKLGGYNPIGEPGWKKTYSSTGVLGVEEDYTYNDPESQLTDVQYPASSALNTHLSYDRYGRSTSIADGSSSLAATYDDLNETLTATTSYSGIAAQTLQYSYNPNGSLEGINTPAGTFSYHYAGGGRPVSLTNPFNETSAWSYLNNNWLQSQTQGNGAHTHYTYNARGFLTELQNQSNLQTLLSDYGTMQYDGAGNKTSQTATVPGVSAASGTTSYQYDAKDELLQEQFARAGSYTNNFSYAAAFNPTSFKGQTASFNANNQNTAYTLDERGNATTYRGTTLTWAAQNRLTQYGGLLTAGYRPDNRRAWKQDNSGYRTYYVYSGGKAEQRVRKIGDEEHHEVWA